MMLPQQQLGGSSVDIACVDVKKEDAQNRAKNSITYIHDDSHITFFKVLIGPKCFFKRYIRIAFHLPLSMKGVKSKSKL